MRKYLAFALAWVLATGLAGCAEEVKTTAESDVVTGSAFDAGMEVVEGTVSPEGATVRVVNNTDVELDSGNAYDFAIEVQKDGTWYSIETEERSNTAEALVFLGERELAIDWSGIYGALPKGNYRLVKYFFPWSEDGAYGIGDGFYLAAEFRID